MRSLAQALDFQFDFGDDAVVGNFSVEAENDENFAAEFLFKGFEIGLHALGRGVNCQNSSGR